MNILFSITMQIIFLSIFLFSCISFGSSFKYTRTNSIINKQSSKYHTSLSILHSDNGITEGTATPSSTSIDSKAKIEGLELLEIRIGKILKIEKHPEADNLYVEQVDLGMKYTFE